MITRATARNSACCKTSRQATATTSSTKYSTQYTGLGWVITRPAASRAIALNRYENPTHSRGAAYEAATTISMATAARPSSPPALAVERPDRGRAKYTPAPPMAKTP